MDSIKRVYNDYDNEEKPMELINYINNIQKKNSDTINQIHFSPIQIKKIV